MIISEKLLNELRNLDEELENILENTSLTDLQIENFFRNFEKRRYNILSEIKLHNKNVE